MIALADGRHGTVAREAPRWSSRLSLRVSAVTRGRGVTIARALITKTFLIK